MQAKVNKRRKYFETAASVVEEFDRYPWMSSTELGRRLGLHPAYVRTALKRNGRRLKRARQS